MLDSVIELMQDVVSVLAGISLHHWALCCVNSKHQGLGKKHIFLAAAPVACCSWHWEYKT